MLNLFLILALTTAVYAQEPPDTMWTRFYGSSDEELVRSMCVGPDGAYVLAAEKWNHINGFDYDISVVKVDSSGNLQWLRTYGDRGHNESPLSIKTLDDGNYVILLIGNTLFEIDNNGDSVSVRPLDLQEGAALNELMESSYQGLFLSGGLRSSDMPSSTDAYLVRTDSSGDTLWTRVYGTGLRDEVYDFKPIENRFILTGVGANSDIYLFLVDSVGNLIWEHIYDIPGSEVAYAVANVTGGGFVLCGTLESRPPIELNAFLLRTDSLGDTLWTISIGDSHYVEKLFDVVEADDGGFVATGYKAWDHDIGYWDSDVYLVKVDTAGNLLWEVTYGEIERGEEAIGIVKNADGGYTIGGEKERTTARPDFYLIRTWPEGYSAADGVEYGPTEFTLSQNYPNPFNGSTKIRFKLENTSPVTLTVFDLLGREVTTLADGVLAAGNYTYYFHADDLPSGVYLYRLRAGDNVSTKKMLLLK